MASRAKQILRQQLEEEFKKKSMVIELLNKFGEVIVKNYVLLQYSIDDIHVFFNYVDERLRYLRQYCEMNNLENSLKHLACLAFKALFLNLDDFKLEDLEKKIQIFKVIIDYFNGIFNKNESDFLNELMEDSCNENLIFLFNQLFKKDFSFFIALVILKYHSNLFNEFMIRKILTYSDIKIDFEYSELKIITVENLINDLFDIFGHDDKENKTTFIHLTIEDMHLKTKDFSNEEIIEALENFDESNKNPIKNSTDVQKTQIKNSIEEKPISKEPKNDAQSQQINQKENEGKKNDAQSQQIESKSINEQPYIMQSPRINQSEINENKSVTQCHQKNPIDIDKNEIQSQEINQKETVEKKPEMITESINGKKNDIKGQEINPKEIDKNNENEGDNIETMKDMNIKFKNIEKVLANLESFKKEKELNEIEIQNYIKQNKENNEKIEKLQNETKSLREELAKEKQAFKDQLAKEKQSLKDEFSKETKTLKEEFVKEKKSNNKKSKALKKENELMNLNITFQDLVCLLSQISLYFFSSCLFLIHLFSYFL